MKRIFILSIALALAITGCSLGNKGQKVINIQDAKTKAVDFINNNLLAPGDKVTVKGITEEDGLYKLTVTLSSGQEVTSYLSKDGQRFYPQSINIAEVEAQKKAQTQNAAAQNNAPVAATDVTKADKAKVELFVMSYCPYGTQIEKGILPVVAALGSKVDFELKFCDYAMHGEKELKENLTQTCIEKNEPQKFAAYLTCFLEADDSAGCLVKAKINKSKLDTCVSSTDKQYKVMEGFNDKSTWVGGNYPKFDVFKADNEKYGVGGSPTLVINGKQVSSGRDPKSLLATVCAGFNTQPEECKQVLSSETPSAGFGSAASGAAASASGGCATN
ncbi:MAG: thioredoxin domain-containing protein [Candidatus Falkowbacteria bacterium]|nr:thioredoxin domain-containing protein [Candidatus Falkowbacteria bacterium]